jgi:chemotaxis protein MotA
VNRHLGIGIVLGCVIGGFLVAGGKLPTLVQPAEFLVIGGAAAGSLIVSLTPPMLRRLMKQVTGVFGRSPFNQATARELLKLLYQFAIVARSEGAVGLEKHLQEPDKSAILTRYPAIMGNPRLLGFLAEGLSMHVDGTAAVEDLSAIFDQGMSTLHTEESVPGNTLQKMGDALPGLGIVAAVLGIIITMGKINEGPELVGHHVAAALVGTFLGVLLSYGFVQPIVSAMEQGLRDEENFLEACATGILAIAQGKTPAVVAEMARRTLFEYNRPGRAEIEEEIKTLRAA